MIEQELETQRQRLADEKAQFERERTLFTRQLSTTGLLSPARITAGLDQGEVSVTAVAAGEPAQSEGTGFSRFLRRHGSVSDATRFAIKPRPTEIMFPPAGVERPFPLILHEIEDEDADQEGQEDQESDDDNSSPPSTPQTAQLQGSPRPRLSSGAWARSSRQEQPLARLQRPTTAALQRRTEAESGPRQLSVMQAAESETLNIYLQALQHPTGGIKTHDVRHNFQYHRGVFSGYDAAEWFMENMEGITTLEAAQSVGQKFVDLCVFTGLGGSTDIFEVTDRALYQFQQYDSTSSSVQRPSRSSEPARRGLCALFLWADNTITATSVHRSLSSADATPVEPLRPQSGLHLLTWLG